MQIRTFVTAFTTDDPVFASTASEWTSIGKNFFTCESGDVRTFLERGEILALFEGYTVIHHWEGLGPEHRHGEGPLQRHAVVELVAQR